MDDEFEKAMNRELRDVYYREHRKTKKQNASRGKKLEKKYCDVCGKACYSKKEAQTMVNCNNRGITNKKLQGYYYCHDCGFYHVTSKKPN